MNRWKKSILKSITTADELSRLFPIDVNSMIQVTKRYPMRITPYYLSLIKAAGDPIWLQCIPDPRELLDDNLKTDPLNESSFSPIPGLIHRYPDRVLLLVSSSCATICRFCLRKYWIGSNNGISLRDLIENALIYIEKNPSIHDVILSGGDPFLLEDEVIEDIIGRLRKIRHIEIIRIGTRTPVTLPERITHSLCKILKRYHPIYINTHFNHPIEITEESKIACLRLADSGIPLGNQTVLLKGINDDPEVMRVLMQKLLKIRVRPYYLHHLDLVKGTSHFRTSIETGLKIISRLRGFTSGLAVPHYVVDLPGGFGKVEILPDDLRREGNTYIFRNYLGEFVKYQDIN